jgi:hypothetical protein
MHQGERGTFASGSDHGRQPWSLCARTQRGQLSARNQKCTFEAVKIKRLAMASGLHRRRPLLEGDYYGEARKI